MSKILLTLDGTAQAQGVAAVNAGLTQMLNLLKEVDKYKDLLNKATGDPKDLIHIAQELAKIEKQLIQLQREQEKLRQDTANADRAQANAATAQQRANDAAQRSAEQLSQREERRKRQLQQQSGLIGQVQERIRRLNQLQMQAGTPEQLARINRMLQQQRERLIQLRNTGRETTNTFGNALSSFQFKFNFLGNSIASLVENAGSAVKEFAAEAIDMSLKADGIKKAFDRLNNPALLDELRTATNGTVSDLELMRSAVKASNFKLPLDQLATYLKFAQQRALETGESVDYLVESIVVGISRKSIPIMDNLGISATSLQTEFKKTGDFGKAAANIIDEELKKTNGGIDNQLVKVQQLKASWENFKLVIGDALVNEFYGYSQWLDVISGKMSVVEMSTNNFITMHKEAGKVYAENLIVGIRKENKAVEDQIKVTNEFIKALEKQRTARDKDYDAQKLSTQEYINQATQIDATIAKLKSFRSALVAPQQQAAGTETDLTDTENRIRLITSARQREIEELKLQRQKELGIAAEKGHDTLLIEQYYANKIAEVNRKYDQVASDQKIKSMEDGREKEIAAAELQMKSELATANETGKNKALIEEHWRNEISKIHAKYDEKELQEDEKQQEYLIGNKIKRREDEKKIARERRDLIIDLQKEEDELIAKLDDAQLQKEKEIAEERKQIAESVIDSAISGIEKKSQYQINAIENEIDLQKEAVDRQRELANQGASNSLAAEERRLAELESKKAEAQRKEEIRQKVETYYSFLSSYAKEDPKTAAQKALAQMAIVEGIAAAFLEKGGIAGEASETTMIKPGGLTRSHKSGDVLAVLSPNEGILNEKQMQNLGGKDGFYSLQRLLDNPMNDDVFRPVESFSGIIAKTSSVDISPVVQKLEEVQQAIKRIPGNSFAVDSIGNLIHTKIEQGKTTITNKGIFISPSRKKYL